MTRQRPQTLLDLVRHIVQIFLYGRFVVMVQHWTGRSRSPIDHLQEPPYLDKRKQNILAVGHPELERSVNLLAHQVDGLVKASERLGHQLQGKQLHLPAQER